MARAALGVLEWGMDRSPFCAPGRAVLQDKHVTVSHVDLKEHLEPVQATSTGGHLSPPAPLATPAGHRSSAEGTAAALPTPRRDYHHGPP